MDLLAVKIKCRRLPVFEDKFILEDKFMKIELQNVLPEEIEKRSFEIIGQELGNIELDPMEGAGDQAGDPYHRGL